jgi:hypothetical protein
MANGADFLQQSCPFFFLEISTIVPTKMAIPQENMHATQVALPEYSQKNNELYLCQVFPDS